MDFEATESRKLIDSLYEMTKENFSVTDDTILDKLFVHIKKKADGNHFSENLRDLGVWLEHILQQWNHCTLCDGVKVFFIRLLGLVGSKPHGFTTIKHLLPEIENLISNLVAQNEINLIVPLINDLALFINHEEGLDWVLRTEVWKHPVKKFYEDRSIYINRSSVKFISLLLTKVGSKKKHKGVEILNFVCEPLVDNCLLTVKPLPNLDRHYISPLKKDSETKCSISTRKFHVIKHLARAAKFLCDILDEMFANDSNLPVKFKCSFTTDLNSEHFPSPQEYQVFLQLLVMLELSNACWVEEDHSREVSSSQTTPPCPMEPLYLVGHQGVRNLMSLGHFHNLTDFCDFCLRHIHRFRVSVPHIHNFAECVKCRELESMLVYQLKMFLELHSSCFCTDFCINASVLHLCTTKCREDTVSCKHLDDDCLKKFNEIVSKKDLRFQYFQHGVIATTRSLKYVFYTISREAISSVVVSSVESLRRHCWLEKAQSSSCLLNLITLISQLVEGYMEQKQLFTTVTWILEKDMRDPRITIKTLQLLNKILKMKVMPHLIILQPSKIMYFENLKEIMPSIKKSLMIHLKNTSSWEIRDTALEVYHLAMEVGDLVVPGLFSMMFDKSLYTLVLQLAAEDEVAYVRSSAFKFFSMAVRANICLHKVSSENLSDLAIKTLLFDEMPGPRMAACDLLAAMFVTDFVENESMCEKVYETVFLASLKELDWEVKKATLRFWQCVITKQIADKALPTNPVFLRSCDPTAKEEVVLKIISVFNTLSDVGCLKVLWMDAIDDSDISVSQEACSVINNILDLNEKWGFTDKIINDIAMEVDEGNLSNKRLSARDFFINICQKDWRENLEARTNWIQNTCDDLPSLLEHILNPDNRDCDHNAVDCY